MSLVQRLISVSIILGEGSFGESGSNTVTLDGYRMTASIAKNGTPAMNFAELRIYGMNQSLMNQLTRVGLVPTAVRNNVVTVMAGDTQAGLSLAFSGVLMDSYADYGAAPDVSFNISAATGYLQALKPVLPSSYPGSTNVADIMANLAKQMGYTFENNGVSVVLSNPYLPGTARQQALAAAEAADIFVVFEDDNGIMAIYPKNGVRNTPVPLISPQTGMVLSPAYIGPGLIQVKSIYNPAVRFGGNIQIESDVVTPANGLWRVTQVTHDLSTQMPDGEWFTTIVGNRQLANS